MSENVILKAFEADVDEFESVRVGNRAIVAEMYIEVLEGDSEMADGETVGIVRDALGYPDGPADIDRFLAWQDAQTTEALAELRKIAGA